MAVSDLFKEKDFLSVATIICKEISESRHSSEYLRNSMSNEVVRIQSGCYKSYADYAGDPEENRSNGDIGGNPNVTDNFMIVEDGLVWTYNEYEIASYSEGHTDILVLWKFLAPYLKSKDIIEAPRKSGIFEQTLNKAEEEGRKGLEIWNSFDLDSADEGETTAFMDGSVKFTIAPKVGNGEKPSSFFFRVKMK